MGSNSPAPFFLLFFVLGVDGNQIIDYGLAVMKTNDNPPARAISHARNAAKRNTRYSASELKFALFDKSWQFCGCFPSVEHAKKYVDRQESGEGWVSGPQVVAL